MNTTMTFSFRAKDTNENDIYYEKASPRKHSL